MPKIHLLPEILAHQIAAGEIVERPASVLKELLENSLDAGASSITIRTEKGGQRLLSVRDNGIGMSPDDSRLAFEHHATSKIHVFEDLSKIRTLGFRGEALPSIAAVSKLTLRTSEKSDSSMIKPGTEVQYQGGELAKIQEISWPNGTEVLVEDLFYNLPARKKFLKSSSTDLGHLTRQLTHFCLAHPSVQFQFTHHGRILVNASASASIEDRIFQVLGESFLENLVSVDYQKNNIKIHGFTSLPHEQRSNTASQFFFINNRIIKDRVIAHAVRHAYRDSMPSRSHAQILLFLEMDPSKVDVNVHPAKTEVRFQDSKTIHSMVFHAIEEALLRNKSDLRSLARTLPISLQKVSLSSEVYPLSPALFSSSKQNIVYRNKHNPIPVDIPSTAALHSKKSDPHWSNIPETSSLSSVPIVLGQFVESFIVAADREGVLLIDQHVAHERILFDKALKAMTENSSMPTQRLLEPLTLELTVEQWSVLEDLLEELNQNGFAVEMFGNRTIVIRAVPALGEQSDGQELLQEILDSFLQNDDQLTPDGFPLQRRREKIAISLACRSAIKINTPLSFEKIQLLLDQLMDCEVPYTCPHGRPIILRVGIEEILRGFKRI